MAADAGITGLLEKLGYQRIEQLGVIQDVTMKDELLLAIAEGELDEEEVKRIQKAHDAHLLEIYNGLAADFRRQFEKLITENELTEQAEFNIFLEIENLRELNYKKALQLIKRRIKNRLVLKLHSFIYSIYDRVLRISWCFFSYPFSSKPETIVEKFKY